MNKSLSESHPTLWIRLTELERSTVERYDADFRMLPVDKVQYFTVDVAEHERLKKELEEEKKFRIEDQEGYDNGWKDGLVEGERRAMERVKVFVTQARHNSVELFGRAKPEWCEGVEDTLKELERIFGLGGEEEKK